MSDPILPITLLLQRHREGDRSAFNEMVPLVYVPLRAIAHRQIARMGQQGRTLGTTALVQEAYLQLVDELGVAWRDRGHFYAICARAMRRILVDGIRQRLASKRGGDAQRVTLDPEQLELDQRAEDLFEIEQAVQGLEAFNERLARVVECRYFAGMTEDETALALGSSVRTVQRDWARARAWLLKALPPE